jgi:hypothetical protein
MVGLVRRPVKPFKLIDIGRNCEGLSLSLHLRAYEQPSQNRIPTSVKTGPSTDKYGRVVAYASKSCALPVKMTLSTLVRKFAKVTWGNKCLGPGTFGTCYTGELEEDHGRRSQWDRIPVSANVLHMKAIQTYDKRMSFLWEAELTTNEYRAVQSFIA